ncbi:McrB family protein [Pedobacter sp. SAFR-022]|uniref:McrB family protein n=1 Tax=Pedobacter sp. SAFR-022 TaxID=3436861 RepID=UPI003F7FF8EB
MTLIDVNNSIVEADIIVDQKTINDEIILPVRKNGTGAQKHHIFVRTKQYSIVKQYLPGLFKTGTNLPQTNTKVSIKNYFKISQLINDIERINGVIDSQKEEKLDSAKLLFAFNKLAAKQGSKTEFYLTSELSFSQNGLGFKRWVADGVGFATEILKFLFHETQVRIFIFKESGISATYWSFDQSNVQKNVSKAEFPPALRDLSSPRQTIYFGAPGTGKSFRVAEVLRGRETTTQRVIFHPDYDYSSFVGGFKPKQDEAGNIGYGFVPQIFTNMYVRAWADLDQDYYIVIEEINRGNCAEIFGDVFQLLDRNPDYKVVPSNEMNAYLIEALGFDHPGVANGLHLPPNLSILATMNTSDQSLYPMDSAFKRRWEWEYIPINYEKGEQNKSSKYTIIIDEETAVNWLDFINTVNTGNISTNPNLGMDKCIGNYFIKPSKDDIIPINDFINKVIFYLWYDVFKDEENSFFLDNTTYESFFPIQTNGVREVKRMMESLSLLNVDQQE